MKRIALLLLVFSVVESASAFDWPSEPTWRPAFHGVDQLDVTLTEPRSLRVHALRVDLGTEGVSLVTDRDNGDRPEEVDGLKTSTFLLRNGCQAAINAAPFWPGQKEEDQPQNVVGLVVSEGKLISPLDKAKPRAALVFRGGAAGAIERAPIELEGVRTAVGGFGVVLRAGRLVRPAFETDDFIDTLHPRSAAGLTADGKQLLLVAVDGRQPGYSEGVDLSELSDLLRWLGATDGLNLDGGGTTTLVVSDGVGGARQANRPIDGGIPGQERVSASHLGVIAAPLVLRN